ncbi:MAG: peptidoglycan-binding protein [Cyanobacteria bacterium CRU_2_1]|nr:peptidoglycan-binding protein [Cyanobacteria bacterium CRU_2_1]
MPQLVMFWDRVSPLGDRIADIEILNNSASIEVPSNACGFRLGFPNEAWDEAWHFAEPGNWGEVFESQGIVYSSAFTGLSPSAIEARGPVNACDSGKYEFQTPLGQFGIAGDDPVVALAGAFVADFIAETDITWLDSAGTPIELPELPEPSEPPELPPEFFEKPPEVIGCLYDFDGDLYCPEDLAAITPGASLVASSQRINLPPGIAMLVASGSGIIPQIRVVSPPDGNANTFPPGEKLELDCPAELALTATFFKAQGLNPATVRYRFRFAHGPVSTVFSIRVDQDGANTVVHAVPIPLPPPIGQPPGGRIPPGPSDITVVVVPPDVVPGGSPSPIPEEPEFQVEALPSNEHKSSVRVEVINASEGVVASPWETYHIVCSQASSRPPLGPGSRGAAVTSLQAGLNRWLQNQQTTPLKVDGIFGTRTEAAIRAFQGARCLDVNGVVKLKDWKQLLSL